MATSNTQVRYDQICHHIRSKSMGIRNIDTCTNKIKGNKYLIASLKSSWGHFDSPYLEGENHTNLGSIWRFFINRT